MEDADLVWLGMVMLEIHKPNHRFEARCCWLIPKIAKAFLLPNSIVKSAINIQSFLCSFSLFNSYIPILPNHFLIQVKLGLDCDSELLNKLNNFSIFLSL